MSEKLKIDRQNERKLVLCEPSGQDDSIHISFVNL